MKITDPGVEMSCCMLNLGLYTSRHVTGYIYLSIRTKGRTNLRWYFIDDEQNDT